MSLLKKSQILNYQIEKLIINFCDECNLENTIVIKRELSIIDNINDWCNNETIAFNVIIPTVESYYCVFESEFDAVAFKLIFGGKFWLNY